MYEGWVKLHRQTLSNPIIMQDSEYLAIWVWLLLNVTHDGIDVVFQGERLTLKSGQITVGRGQISRALHISESKVQRVLKCFENEQQIEQQMSSKCRLISVKNWGKYQETEQQNEQHLNSKRTAFEQQVNTKQECNNERMKEDTISSIQENFIDNRCSIVSSEKKEILATDAPTPAQEAKLFFTDLNKQESIISYLVEKKIPDHVARSELGKFIDYWTEPTRNGVKQRWELEKAFEIRRRLVTWFSRSNRNVSRLNNNQPKGIAL